MERCNNSIKCDVCECMHNVQGKNCNLGCIKVTNGSSACTCCDSFENKDKF